MPCPKKVPKELYKKKRQKQIYRYTFLYLLGEETNQRYVLGRSVVPKTPDSKMVLLVRQTLPEKEKGNIVSFFKRKSFFLLCMRHLFFRKRPLGVSSNLIVFFLSIYLFFLNLIFYLFIRFLQIDQRIVLGTKGFGSVDQDPADEKYLLQLSFK